MTSIPRESPQVGSSISPRRATIGTQVAILWGRAGDASVLLVNTDLSRTVYVGDATVAPGSGLPVPPGGSVTVDGRSDWYGVTDSGTAQIWAMPGGSTYTPTTAGATSTASATASINSTATLIAAPGTGKQLLLRGGTLSVNVFGLGTAGPIATVTVSLARADTGAAFWSTQVALQPTNTAPANTQESLDFEAMPLPDNVGVNLTVTGPGASVSAFATANLNYSS